MRINSLYAPFYANTPPPLFRSSHLVQNAEATAAQEEPRFWAIIKANPQPGLILSHIPFLIAVGRSFSLRKILKKKKKKESSLNSFNPIN